MSSQIFKTIIPNEILFNLLENISLKSGNKYTINKDAYKKGLYDNSILQFIDQIIPYYYVSKRKYFDRKLTYNSFTTIIRQICKCNKILYTSEIKYNKSTYDIYYYIHS